MKPDELVQVTGIEEAREFIARGNSPEWDMNDEEFEDYLKNEDDIRPA